MSEEEKEKCPECGGENVSGLVAAYWVSMKGDIISEIAHASQSSDIGDERMCDDCNHEWEV